MVYGCCLICLLKKCTCTTTYEPITVELPALPGLDSLPQCLLFYLDNCFSEEQKSRITQTIAGVISFWQEFYEEKAAAGTLSAGTASVQSRLVKNIDFIKNIDLNAGLGPFSQSFREWANNRRNVMSGEEALDSAMELLTQRFKDIGEGHALAKFTLGDQETSSSKAGWKADGQVRDTLSTIINPAALNKAISDLELIGSLLRTWFR
ncbi:hypothetical protein [Metabacillus sp. FJAT-52054]|uniref:Uncharacterized protein n=1 Tax=Metabacillus sediminis TaxID=3117746 RepID=A0ABZ2NDQ8_9BACI